MGFQALFKFVKCWRAPDVVRETVPSSWGGDGERALAEFQTNDGLTRPGIGCFIAVPMWHHWASKG